MDNFACNFFDCSKKQKQKFHYATLSWHFYKSPAGLEMLGQSCWSLSHELLKIVTACLPDYGPALGSGELFCRLDSQILMGKWGAVRLSQFAFSPKVQQSILECHRPFYVFPEGVSFSSLWPSKTVLVPELSLPSTWFLTCQLPMPCQSLLRLFKARSVSLPIYSAFTSIISSQGDHVFFPGRSCSLFLLLHQTCYFFPPTSIFFFLPCLPCFYLYSSFSDFFVFS